MLQALRDRTDAVRAVQHRRRPIGVVLVTAMPRAAFIAALLRMLRDAGPSVAPPTMIIHEHIQIADWCAVPPWTVTGIHAHLTEFFPGIHVPRDDEWIELETLSAQRDASDLTRWWFKKHGHKFVHWRKGRA